MANINVNNIKPAGAELFVDSESFMSDLDENEVNHIYGGAKGAKDIVTNYCTQAASCMCLAKNVGVKLSV